MSEFDPNECDWIYLEGGAMDGQIIPVAWHNRMIQFHTKGEVITYIKVTPIRFHDEHIVFKITE